MQTELAPQLKINDSDKPRGMLSEFENVTPTLLVDRVESSKPESTLYQTMPVTAAKKNTSGVNLLLFIVICFQTKTQLSNLHQVTKLMGLRTTVW